MGDDPNRRSWPPLRLIARAWAAYERMVDGKGTPMPFALRRESHQAFYAGASVAFHLARKASTQTRANHREMQEALRAELEEWSQQFDTTIFGDVHDATH